MEYRKETQLMTIEDWKAFHGEDFYVYVSCDRCDWKLQTRISAKYAWILNRAMCRNLEDGEICRGMRKVEAVPAGSVWVKDESDG